MIVISIVAWTVVWLSIGHMFVTNENSKLETFWIMLSGPLGWWATIHYIDKRLSQWYQVEWDKITKDLNIDSEDR